MSIQMEDSPVSGKALPMRLAKNPLRLVAARSSPSRPIVPLGPACPPCVSTVPLSRCTQDSRSHPRTTCDRCWDACEVLAAAARSRIRGGGAWGQARGVAMPLADGLGGRLLRGRGWIYGFALIRAGHGNCCILRRTGEGSGSWRSFGVVKNTRN